MVGAEAAPVALGGTGCWAKPVSGGMQTALHKGCLCRLWHFHDLRSSQLLNDRTRISTEDEERQISPRNAGIMCLNPACVDSACGDCGADHLLPRVPGAGAVGAEMQLSSLTKSFILKEPCLRASSDMRGAAR